MNRSLLFLAAMIAAAVIASPAMAVMPVNVTYPDARGYGFSHNTLGLHRRVAFETALRTWTNQLTGTVPLEVVARFEPMGGDALSATLAYAGPLSVARDFPGAQPGTWYVTALGNQLAGYDLDPGAADIEVVVNSDVDNSFVLGALGFYYGMDGNAGSSIDFRTTILHEIGHGLGFISLIDPYTGRFFQAPGDPAPLPDMYSRMLASSKKPYFSSKTKPLHSLRRDKQRAKALRSGEKLRWSGPATYAAKGFLASIYAPKNVEPGSSVSHWDSGNFPDLLMEPFATGPKFSIDLSKQALQDMGWTFVN